MFKKILIANRGEIARRVIHACREMKINTVAIYSDPDQNALHVREADESYSLQGIEAAETYLDIEKILKIAKDSKAEAIHPGYGFLSENAAFAEACKKAKITFIGPDVKALKLLGSKVASKELAKKANVPTVPGYVGATGNSPLPHGKELEKIAESIGYPLLVKAAAGGGGKGMRIVHHHKELGEMVEGAEREALAFFKDKTLFLEKYFEHPKHIEVQVLGDEHGTLIHLFERECSVQRRHQKMIEESPSSSLSPELRQEICEAALRVVREANYSSAGTVEFLLDQKGHYYFLEVNTRLQVEHPITELVTGIDLVKAQIRIAAGEKLWIKQEDIAQRGHAIECRLYAEDPENDFLPAEGRTGFLLEPSRPGVRIDSALEPGKPILPFYDPMLAKLIVWGADRPEAISRMEALLRDYTLLGVRHNLDFLRYTLRSKPFESGQYHTHSVAQLLEGFKNERKRNETLSIALGLLASLESPAESKKTSTSHRDKTQPSFIAGFRNV